MNFKDLAWNNFCKTGDIQSFLEYKKIGDTNFEYQNTQQIMQNLEGMINEVNKSQGNSNKGSTI